MELGVCSFALFPAIGRAYVPNGGGSTVAVLDTENDTLLTTVSALAKTLRDAAKVTALREAATAEAAREILLSGATGN